MLVNHQISTWRPLKSSAAQLQHACDGVHGGLLEYKHRTRITGLEWELPWSACVFHFVLICKKAAGRNLHMGNELLTVNEIYLETDLWIAEPPLFLLYVYFKQLISR